MLYNLQNVLALEHSAKGTTWSKHKYIKKVGNRYYYATDIEAANRRMKAADKYNNDMRNARLRETNGLKALNNNFGAQESVSLSNVPEYSKRASNIMSRAADERAKAKRNYDNSMFLADMYQGVNSEHRLSTRVTLKALNASAAFKEKISKGKSLVAKLFKKK